MMNPSSPAAVTAAPTAGHGVEIGRFRLKAGAGEVELRAAHAAIVREYASRQVGWLQQHLLKLDDEVFVDVVFADSRERVEAICAGWQGQGVCEAFLGLIDAESIQFGEVL